MIDGGGRRPGAAIRRGIGRSCLIYTWSLTGKWHPRFPCRSSEMPLSNCLGFGERSHGPPKTSGKFYLCPSLGPIAQVWPNERWARRMAD